MASLGATVLDRITSEISRLRAMSSLQAKLAHSLDLQRSNVQAAPSGLFDLFVQSRIGRGRPPGHHLEMSVRAARAVPRKVAE